MDFTVFIFSNRNGFSCDIADRIRDMGCNCTIGSTFLQLMKFVKNTPDLKLLLIDTQTFPIPRYDLQQFVFNHKRHFAVHFLSDIQATNMTLNSLDYNMYFDIIHDIRPILVKDRDYYRIIGMTNGKRTAEEKDLLHKYHLRPGHVFILKYLESHKDRLIHLDSMDRYLWPLSQKNHIQTLYAYIHQLRNILPGLNPYMIIERPACNTYCYHDSSLPATKEDLLSL